LFVQSSIEKDSIKTICDVSNFGVYDFANPVTYNNYILQNLFWVLPSTELI